MRSPRPNPPTSDPAYRYTSETCTRCGGKGRAPIAVGVTCTACKGHRVIRRMLSVTVYPAGGTVGAD